MAAIAGNHVIIAVDDSTAFVALVHLRAGSLAVAVGEPVRRGQVVAECGNSGNSTQLHVHLQVMDGPDAAVAAGLPAAFTRFREWSRGARTPRVREAAVPDDGAVVEPLAVA